MSKTKTSKTTKNKKNEDEVVSVDLSVIFIPIAILFSGIIISISIFVGLLVTRPGTTNEANNNNNNNNNNVAQEDTKIIPPQQENPEVQVKIGDDPVLGDRDSAKIAIVEFSDYECPFCKRYHEQTFDQIVENYVKTGKAIAVYKDFPLGFHDPLATKEAMAAECVQDLAGDEVYFQYGALIYKNTKSNGNGLEVSKLYDLAEEVGVNRGEFTECFDSEKYKDEVQEDIKTGTSVGISGTPGFVIGVIQDDGETVDGVRFVGAQPYSNFEKVIEEQLAR